MNFDIDIINLSCINRDTVDYETIIFYINYPEKTDIDTYRGMSIFLTTIINGGAKKIIVDLKKVNLIDSAGISTLISATKAIRKNKGDLVITRVNESIQNILDIIKIDKFIKVFNNDIEALHHFSYINS